MPTAILIGFEYRMLTVSPDGKQKTPSLGFPGTVIDLNLAHIFCKEQDWKIIVITDILEEKFPEGIVQVITDGRVSMRSLTFYSNNSKDFRLVTNRNQLLTTLTDEIKGIVVRETKTHSTSTSNIPKDPDKNLFIYYTGHGTSTVNGASSILLPNAETVAFDEIRAIINTNFFGDGYIFGVLDCCHPTSMKLPYSLDLKGEIPGAEIEELLVNKGPKEHKWKLFDDYKACTQDFLLITSASNDQSSAATKYGSLFSEFFFRYLRQLNYPLSEAVNSKWPSRNLVVIANSVANDIVKRSTKVKQTISIYSAYKVQPIIPLWVGAVKMDITIDYKSKTIICNEH